MDRLCISKKFFFNSKTLQNTMQYEFIFVSDSDFGSIVWHESRYQKVSS